ncbi:MAG: prefoldin subunit alpha [Candidatus Micrarchaeota archaeon]|nr:prefoldin subunit alpha [Candidatus Micrarchaeota archaeon]MDE1834322.1 prefoldin subunit alpha [Candidatus Micrarchaeota archaeon]MDE1859099.1 prefoldin subunit alpha [Candidatus Micrarchaeota archaeon]
MADNQYDAQEIMMQLRYLQEVYSRQYEAIEDQIASYTVANAALQRNLDLLNSLDEIGNSAIVIGGEGGAYVPAKLGKADKAMTYIGGGYLVEKDIPDAADFLRSNQKKSEEFLHRLLADKQKIEGELMDIAFKMNALSQQQQGQQ